MSRPSYAHAQADYPFFTTLNRIVNGKLPPTALLEYQKPQHHAPEPSGTNSDNGASASSADAPVPAVASR